MTSAPRSTSDEVRAAGPSIDDSMIRTPARGEVVTASRYLSANCTGLSKGLQLGVRQTQLAAQDLVGVLTQPRDPRLGTLRHLGHAHRVAGDEDGLLLAVGAWHLDEHVPGGHMG